jgi:hypothetical protein
LRFSKFLPSTTATNSYENNGERWFCNAVDNGSGR